MTSQKQSFVAGTTTGTAADANLTTTPAPLTVGSLKLATVSLGDYADFLSGANMDADFNTLPRKEILWQILESIFYKIGLKAKDSLGTAITDLKEADNTWTGTNDFEKAVTVSYADGTALDIKGTASTSDKLTAHSLSSTGDINAKGGITVTGNATISKDLTVNGNLTISGAESVIDSDQLDITDNIFALSKGASGGIYAKDSGLYFERGSDKPASAFVFDESAESFVVGTLEGEVIPAGASNSDFTIEVSGAPNLTSIVITPTNVQGFNAAWPTTTTLYDNTTTYLYFIINSSTTYNDLVTAANNFSPHANTNYFANATAKVTLKAGVTGTDTLWATYEGATSTPSFTAGVTNPPSNSNGEIANTTPAPLTVGSLKLTSQGAVLPQVMVLLHLPRMAQV